VKKYRGSLSGEHGDGRLRGEFIRTMVGDECFQLLVSVKRLFDPQGIFNPGKIIDTPPMDTSLRILPGEPEPHHDTVFRFADTGGVLRAAEKCTGVGQCRKSAAMGGTMCPSYMATRDEQHTTRARANVLRQALSSTREAANPWTQPEIADVMDLCLSCKACKSECPSNVDMARLKAEWQQHLHDVQGVPLRSRLIAGSATAMRWASLVPWAYNFAVSAPGVSGLLKRFMGFAAGRSLPPLHRTTLTAWLRHREQKGDVRRTRGGKFSTCRIRPRAQQDEILLPRLEELLTNRWEWCFLRVNGEGGGLAGPQEPLLRALDLPIFHLGKHPVVAAALHDRAREHDPPLELFPTIVGKHHFSRYRPIADLFRVPAGGIDVRLHPQLVGADDAGQRITRLHPFPLMRKYLHHHAVER
jgi:ferredoxin